MPVAGGASGVPEAMCAFSSFEGLNTGTSLAGTMTSSPLRGLRARRARRSRTLNVPKPRISR